MSLNRGTAEVRLSPGNAVTIKQIRDLVNRSGFTPKEARVRASGIIEKKDGYSVLVVGKRQQFRLRPSPDADEPAALEQLEIPNKQPVIVEGVIPADSHKEPVLELLSVSATSDNSKKREAK